MSQPQVGFESGASKSSDQPEIYHTLFLAFDGVQLDCKGLLNSLSFFRNLNPDWETLNDVPASYDFRTSYTVVLAAHALCKSGDENELEFEESTYVSRVEWDAETRREVLEEVKEHYASFPHLRVTDVQPENGFYSTVAFIDKPMTDFNSAWAGLSLGDGSQDCGNYNPSNVVVVRVNSYAESFIEPPSDPAAKVFYLANLISHEAGHSFGLDHTQNSFDIMASSYNISDNPLDNVTDLGFSQRSAYWGKLKNDTDFGVFSGGFLVNDGERACPTNRGQAPQEVVDRAPLLAELPWQDTKSVLQDNLGPRYTCGYLAAELYGWRLLHVAPASEGGGSLSWEQLVNQDSERYYAEGWEPLEPSEAQPLVEDWLNKHEGRLSCAGYEQTASYSRDPNQKRLDDYENHVLDPGNLYDYTVRRGWRHPPFEWKSPVYRTIDCPGGCFMRMEPNEKICDGCS